MPSVVLDTQNADLPAPISAVLVDPAAYADQRIGEAYRWLRANNPLGLATPAGFDPFWVVTKHADILEVSRQNALFSSGERQIILTTQAADRRIREANGGEHRIINSLVSMDEPEHLKHRALTQAWFLPQNLRKIEARVQAIARRSVDALMTTGGRCDFVRGMALGYPLHVIMDILGVPEADEPRMLALTQQIFGPQDPDTARAEGDAEDPARWADQLQGIFSDYSGYFSRITADRRARPQDDIATVIAQARIDGEPIADREAMGYYIIIATAGHDTTSSSTAAAMLALCRDSTLLGRLQADPTLLPSFVEEAIRWATPVKHFMRCATQDTVLRGRHIRRGDLLMLCYASGNRDEEVFEDAESFRADRSPNRQLAFGYGAHLCLGQHLARMEMRLLFEELLPRLRSVTLDGEPALSEATFVNGLKRLPIRFEIALA